MSNEKKPGQDETVECAACLKENAISEAMSVEAEDYFLHFCGMDCYAKWKDQNKKERE
jgi:hypothetical protein